MFGHDFFMAAIDAIVGSKKASFMFHHVPPCSLGVFSVCSLKKMLF